MLLPGRRTASTPTAPRIRSRRSPRLRSCGLPVHPGVP